MTEMKEIQEENEEPIPEKQKVQDKFNMIGVSVNQLLAADPPDSGYTMKE